MSKAFDGLEEVFDDIRRQREAEAEAERVERTRVARSRWVLEEILSTLQRIEARLTPPSSNPEDSKR